MHHGTQGASSPGFQLLPAVAKSRRRHRHLRSEPTLFDPESRLPIRVEVSVYSTDPNFVATD
jgi:hypothetical protein